MDQSNKPKAKVTLNNCGHGVIQATCTQCHPEGNVLVKKTTPMVEQREQAYDEQMTDLPWHLHNGTMRTDTGDPVYLRHEKTLEFIVNAVNSFETMRTVLQDARETLKRLPDAEGAYRVTVLQEIEKALRGENL